MAGLTSAGYEELARKTISYYPSERPLLESLEDARQPIAMVYATLALTAAIRESTVALVAALRELEPGPP